VSTAGSPKLDVKTVIETGDAAALRAVLATDPSLANALVTWGEQREIRTHPLHYVSDMIAAKRVDPRSARDVVDALISGGANVNYQVPRHGETALIGAASLGAEDVGLQLLDAGADPNLLGAFGETALHWAAVVGLDRLTAALIAKGADVNLKDGKYAASPLGWALHGWGEKQIGDVCRHREVVAHLLAAGALVEPPMFELPKVRADAAMTALLARSHRR
jgi:hypothetical protein